MGIQAATSSHQSLSPGLFPAVLTGSEPPEKSSRHSRPVTRSPLTLLSHTPDPAPSIPGHEPGFSGIFLNFLAFFLRFLRTVGTRAGCGIDPWWDWGSFADLSLTFPTTFRHKANYNEFCADTCRRSCLPPRRHDLPALCAALPQMYSNLQITWEHHLVAAEFKRGLN